jgi:hypothetical protein
MNIRQRQIVGIHFLSNNPARGTKGSFRELIIGVSEKGIIASLPEKRRHRKRNMAPYTLLGIILNKHNPHCIPHEFANCGCVHTTVQHSHGEFD